MSDVTTAYLEARDLGRVEQQIALRGKIAIAAGVKVPANLCRTTEGIFVVGAKSSDQGIAIDLSEREDVRYEPRRLGDKLAIGEIELVVPPRSSSDARLAIALGRLAKTAKGGARTLRLGRHIVTPGPIERAFLDGFLAPDEVLLAWQRTEKEAWIDSKILPGIAASAYFVLTDRRAARVVLSLMGDVRIDLLDDAHVAVDPTLGGTDVVTGRFRWRIGRSEVELWEELIHLISLKGGERLRVTARRNWIGRSDPASLAFCRFLLSRAMQAGDPLASFAAYAISCDLNEPSAAAPDIEQAVAALAEKKLPREALASLWENWKLSPEAATTLLDRLRQLGDKAEPWTLALHERLHARLRELRRDPKRLARADVELAEHLIAYGERERARDLLEARLAELPSEELEDLLPKSDADLTTGTGGQVIRIRLFELLADARRAAPGERDPKALAELARLQPLVLSRVRALAEVAEGPIKRRAEKVLRVLSPGGLAESSRQADAPPDDVKPLSNELIQEILQHPEAREGSVLVGKIQALLAVVPSPDHRMLLEYVEPITVARQSEAARALARASRVLGGGDIQGFVSRGKKGIGLRAYEGPPSVLLIGGRHLDDDPDYGMRSAELSFAIATEVAHLVYGHTRVTSSELWNGMLERGKQGLELLVGALPLFRGWKAAESMYKIIQKIPTQTIARALGGAEKVRSRLRERRHPNLPPARGEDVLGAVQEDLVAAARVMQLTADRAGLVVCGDLASSLRSMLLVRPKHKTELDLAEREGVDALLRQRTAEGSMAHEDLSVRIAALVSFYLSDDYARLRSAITG